MPDYRAADYSEYKKRKAKELKRFGLPQGKCRVCGSTFVGADGVVRDGKLVVVARKLCSECDPVYQHNLEEALKVKTCPKCGTEYTNSTLGVCTACLGIGKHLKTAEPTFDQQPYRYAMQYGRDAIIQTLTERWTGRPAGDHRHAEREVG